MDVIDSTFSNDVSIHRYIECLDQLLANHIGRQKPKCS